MVNENSALSELSTTTTVAETLANAKAAAWLSGLLAIVTVAVWANGSSAPFIFDDVPAIVQNSTIRPPYTAEKLLFAKPQGGKTTDGRPLLNVTFALNYKWDGLLVLGYHITNISIHVVAVLLLFGLLLETFSLSRLPITVRKRSTSLAFMASLLWAVHPLHSSAVTYIVQRAESLASVFYMLVLFGLVRSVRSLHPNRWLALSVAACFLGVFAKELLATAPIAALLFDGLLITGSWRATWSARWRYYLLLFATWLPLAALIIFHGGRSSTISTQEGISSIGYLLAQAKIIPYYFGMVVGVEPVILDFGANLPPVTLATFVGGAFLTLLLGITVYLITQVKPIAFPLALVYLVLAPTSSVIPVVTQIGAAHRMYLPSAAILALITVFAFLTVHAILPRRALAICGLAVLAVAAGFSYAAIQRNILHIHPIRLWEVTADQVPYSLRARESYWAAMLEAGRAKEALEQLNQQIEASPNDLYQYVYRSRVHIQLDDLDAALADIEHAASINPNLAEIYNDWGVLLQLRGEVREALAMFTRALELMPTSSKVYNNRAACYRQLNDRQAAMRDIELALETAPWNADVHFNKGSLLVELKQREAAIAAFKEALFYNAEHQSSILSLAKLSR